MILFDYNNYMFEATQNTDNYVNLYLSQRFLESLRKMSKENRIVKKILEMLVDGTSGLCSGKFNVSFVDVTEKDDTISYMLSSKAKVILDKYATIKKEHEGINLCWLGDRQEQKLTRFVNRIFPGDFEHKEIEDFVKEYKTALASDKIMDKFEFLEGTDITKYYYGGNYSREATGHLQRSCMKYDHCEKYFKIYEENPDKMKMLVLKDPTGKIYGRANIWWLDEPSGKIFMDRIYTTYDWQTKLYIDYAIKNNYIYKSRQIYGGNVIPLISNDKKERMIISVNLKPKKYDLYPYIDTMQFYNPNTGNLTSDVSKFKDENYLTLVLANGGYYDGDDNFRFDYLGRLVHPQFVRWSKYDQVFVHVNDAVGLGYRDDYVTPDHEFIKIGGTVYLKDDMEKDEETGNYRLKKNF
jgi:hypothetical protein